jgi:hypothetical protein
VQEQMPIAAVVGGNRLSLLCGPCLIADMPQMTDVSFLGDPQRRLVSDVNGMKFGHLLI